MLDSLTIRNFRLFEELTIERLGRVNLIVGKNNTGKSCLLEAVELFLNDFHPLSIAEIFNRRGEQDSYLLAPESSRIQSPQERHPVSNFFHNGKTNQTISILTTVNRSKLTRTACIAYYRENNEGLLFHAEQPEKPDALSTRPFLESTSEFPVKQDNKLYRFKFPVDISLADVLSKKLAPHSKRAVYIPQNGLETSAIGTLWNEISLSDKRDTIKRYISEAFPEIVDVDVVYQRSSGYEIRARLINNRIVNINSLGDGVRRYFGIMLAAITSNGQTLLIDEFENGLHYSLHEQLWINLSRLAVASNIQIFATTHSKDCVEAFCNAERTGDDDGILIRLGRSVRTSNKGQIVAQTYERDELTNLLAHEMEVR